MPCVILFGWQLIGVGWITPGSFGAFAQRLTFLISLAGMGNLQHHVSGIVDPCEFMDVKLICALPVVAI